jgi:Double-GTPase 2
VTKCPRCFSVLTPHQHLWMMPPHAGGTRYLDEVGSAFLGAPAECGPFYKWDRPPGYHGPPPPSADASRALQGPVVEVCPVCHYQLPDGWRDGHATCIAMAGARATGKSLYIAVLVKQLELLCENLGVSMEPATRATATAYSAHYETPLFVQRGLIPPTPTVHTQASLQREPLIFSIGIWQDVRRYLVLRDVAGEDMETGDLSAPPFRFFANADGVFFMFDPLRVKSIRDQLQDLLPAQMFSGGDPRSVLNNVMLAIGRGQPRLAVILSKFDALRVLRDVEGSEWSLIMSNAGAAYLRDTSDAQHYDEAGGQLLHEEVRSLLARLNAASMVAAVENPSTGMRLAYRYFVVSSLGQPPSGNRLHARGIAPFRCADPVRWITSSFGLL